METLNNEVIMLIVALVLNTKEATEHFKAIETVPDKVCLSSIEVDEGDRTFEIVGLCRGGWMTSEVENDCLEIEFAQLNEDKSLQARVDLKYVKCFITF